MSTRTAVLSESGASAGPALTTAILSGIGISLILIWEYSGSDRWVMNQLADSRGFALQNNWWLRVVLHDGLRWVSTLAYAALIIAVWKPYWFLRAATRLQLVEMLVGVTAALLAVNSIKNSSLTSCPWDLAQFGGIARYVSHWAWGLADGGPGRCFPSGHASAGYAFFPVALPFLFASSAATHQRGRRIIYAVLVFGLICGAAQVLRGAHYPSHALWTGLICWVVALINHLIFKYTGKVAALPENPAPVR